MPTAIPGFDQASAQEQWERNEAHLRLPQEVCGVRLRQITPLDVCRLHTAKSPFLVGGVVRHEHIAQFIFLLWDNSNKRLLPMTMRSAANIASELPIEHWQNEIEEFLAVTYRDQPSSGNTISRDAPIAPSVSWLLYRMGCEPFKWSAEKTYGEPLRIIHQWIRCWQDEQGRPVINRLSDQVKNKWQEWLNGELQAGRWTINEYGYPEEVKNG